MFSFPRKRAKAFSRLVGPFMLPAAGEECLHCSPMSPCSVWSAILLFTN